MALIRCRECSASVSSAARQCPHCGVRTPGARPATGAQAKDSLGCFGWTFLIIIGIFALSFVLRLFGVDTTDPCEKAYGEYWMTDSSLDGTRACTVPGTEGTAPYPE